MRIIKTVFLLIAMVMAMPIGVQAQLKKTSNTEKVKSFTNGSVTLYKSVIEDGNTVYSVSLRNNSKYLDNIVFHLGNEDEVIKNLHDLSTALKEGKKGDSFEFSASGVDYLLSYDKVLGQVCFRVSKPHSITDNFGRFYKATIDNIIAYLEKDNK
jgi:hypothetical protein